MCLMIFFLTLNESYVYKGSEMAQMQSSLVECVLSHSVMSDSAVLRTEGYGQ